MIVGFLSVDGDKKITEHFKLKEFACKNSEAIIISEKLCYILEAIRTHYGKQVTITSGYRTPEHNAKIGGAVKSQHMLGLAADIKIPGVKPSDIASYARTLMPTYGGIGIYSTFTHIDVRDKISNWKE